MATTAAGMLRQSGWLSLAPVPDGANAAGGFEDEWQELGSERGRVDAAGVGADRECSADAAVRLHDRGRY